MRAVVVRTPGGPERLELVDLPAPRPAPHEVLLDVHATALNRADLLQRRGLYPPPAGESEVLGLECAGVVRTVGSQVTTARAGDRVMALLGSGGYAEQCTVHESLLLPVPPNLTLSQAAAVPEAFLTAHAAISLESELEPGERVLIHAAAGGVGSAAVQLSHQLGAYVFGVAGSPEKIALIERLGADRAIHRTREDFAGVVLEQTGGRGVDVILDFVGAAYAEQHQRVLATGGRWVMVGLLGGSRASFDLWRVISRRHRLLGLVMRTRPFNEKAAIIGSFRRDFWPWLAEGRLAPVIDSVYPLERVQEAHGRMEQNLNLGKIVLSVRQGDA